MAAAGTADPAVTADQAVVADQVEISGHSLTVVRVSAAMAVISGATWDPELRDRAYVVYSTIEDDAPEDEAGRDAARIEAWAGGLMADLQPRVLGILRDFVRSSAFQPENFSHAAAEQLMRDLTPDAAAGAGAAEVGAEVV
jgi:hypothetical protein